YITAYGTNPFFHNFYLFLFIFIIRNYFKQLLGCFYMESNREDRKSINLKARMYYCSGEAYILLCGLDILILLSDIC
ncbi:hypothetical protein, partial [Porcipelethomonas sp.]|uniref:hypothetical protein n=1 Tax=Porcipelethomonas sp. TaxID=2981675 RepID=UPI003EF46DEC